MSIFPTTTAFVVTVIAAAANANSKLLVQQLCSSCSKMITSELLDANQDGGKLH